ncbi:MAG: MerC domain-containing protein [Pseudomonadota bacterium]|nr:MerC domain-containing protein [Pseudomonadota bacterium]
MKNSQLAMDKAAIGLSLACLAHCLLSLMPLLILPSLGAAFLEDERFHYGILFLVLPTSLLALVMGFRKHGQYSVPIIGVIGLCVLLLVALLGEETTGDIAITVAGSLIVAYAHARNLVLGHSGFRPIAGSD